MIENNLRQLQEEMTCIFLCEISQILMLSQIFFCFFSSSGKQVPQVKLNRICQLLFANDTNFMLLNLLQFQDELCYHGCLRPVTIDKIRVNGSKN